MIETILNKVAQDRIPHPPEPPEEQITPERLDDLRKRLHETRQAVLGILLNEETTEKIDRIWSKPLLQINWGSPKIDGIKATREIMTETEGMERVPLVIEIFVGFIHNRQPKDNWEKISEEAKNQTVQISITAYEEWCTFKCYELPPLTAIDSIQHIQSNRFYTDVHMQNSYIKGLEANIDAISENLEVLLALQ